MTHKGKNKFRECHNHQLETIPDTKRWENTKQFVQNKKKCMKSTKTSSLFWTGGFGSLAGKIIYSCTSGDTKGKKQSLGSVSHRSQIIPDTKRWVRDAISCKTNAQKALTSSLFLNGGRTSTNGHLRGAVTSPPLGNGHFYSP